MYSIYMNNEQGQLPGLGDWEGPSVKLQIGTWFPDQAFYTLQDSSSCVVISL